MKTINYKRLGALIFAFAFLSVGVANAQWGSPNAYGYNTGYGAVYGSFGLASTMQSMYNVAKAQSQKSADRNRRYEQSCDQEIVT